VKCTWNFVGLGAKPHEPHCEIYNVGIIMVGLRSAAATYRCVNDNVEATAKIMILIS
jgi:hypothetical protein